jgi:NAD-dependent deacetylase
VADDHDALIALLSAARRILVFSGAGISTDSGIPDFRGPQGVWTRRNPVYIDEFLASDAKRREYWEQKVEGYEQFRDARPNPAHHAVVALDRLGRLEAAVTQNIDGLHQAAGLDERKLIEVHGTNRLVECVSCGALAAPAEAVARFSAERRVPTCGCGGWLKFATISFGQALRREVLERARRAAEAADLVVAVGSTLSVQPAASIPLVAVRRGAPYVVINRGETDHDEVATLRIEGDVVDVLPPAVRALDPA